MLFAQLLTSIDQKFCRDDGKAYSSLGAWAEKTPVILDGRPFSFFKHEYLMVPYADNHPHMVESKAAQMGLTTKAMLRAMFAARYRNFRGILYLFPSKTDVTFPCGRTMRRSRSGDRTEKNCFLLLFLLTAHCSLTHCAASFSPIADSYPDRYAPLPNQDIQIRI